MSGIYRALVLGFVFINFTKYYYKRINDKINMDEEGEVLFIVRMYRRKIILMSIAINIKWIKCITSLIKNEIYNDK